MDQLKPSRANSSPLTPLGFLERAATVYGDCKSIIYDNTSKSYTWSQTYRWSETYRRCLQLASSLKNSHGINYGDVVSVVAPNIPAMYELQFSVPMAGAILNTINTSLDARTISVILRHSESKLVFVDILSRSLVLEAVSIMLQTKPPPALVFITDDVINDDPSIPAVDFDSSYEGLIQKGDAGFDWIRPRNEWDPMVLNYTSGTTSSPKGVVHSHRGLFITTVDSLIDWSVPKQPVFLWTLPMFHGNGWTFSWGMAAVGGTNICVRKFDASSVYDAIRRHGVTHMCGAPVVLNMLANVSKPVTLPHPVHLLTGGSPPPSTILLRTESLGFVVGHGYGLTETAGVVVSCAWKPEWNRLPASERARLKARQGVRTAAMDEVDVVDPESGLSVERNGSTLGEIVLRGRSLMLGYFKDPMGTSKALRENGWFYTGDVGVMHSDGYLEIKDRSKDVIISGGDNMSSIEVESVLYSHPAIHEAAVVAQPDEFLGETPCAFVSLKSESKRPTDKEIIEFCRARLPHYMVPKTIVFKEELPKTSTGKIQKFLLRDMAKAMRVSKMSRM